MSISIRSIDHLVLTVIDIEVTCSFYEKVLGMKRQGFGDGRVALHFGSQKINLHPSGKPVDKNVLHATPGSTDLCLITDQSMDEVMRSLEKNEVKIIEGPGPRTGARGPIESVYFYDPDENLIEVATYNLEGSCAVR